MKGTLTEQNLIKAYAGESQARNRYEYFAKIAKKEGYEQIAAIFMETADNELNHAKNFLKPLKSGEGVEIVATFPAGKLGTTLENLKQAASGESEEWTELYPHFADVAEEEGYNKIAALFRNIAKVEKAHEERFNRIIDLLESDTYFDRGEVLKWKCRKCGYIHVGPKPPAICPACIHPVGYFEVDYGI